MWWIRSLQILASAAGAFLIGLAVRNTVRGAVSKRWPQVDGRILRSFVLVEKDSDGGEDFMPQVEFQYMVDAKVHRGKRIQYGRIGTSSRRRADRVLTPYTAGASVRVFFDPRTQCLFPGSLGAIR